MKKLLLSLAVILSFSSCDDYIQLIYTSPSGNEIKRDNNFYVYENETIKLVYSFWNEHGIMSFMIYNKAEVPIYIDWNRSSFINQSKRIPYYSDRTTNNINVKTNSGSLGWLAVYGGYTTGGSTGSSVTSGSQTIAKEEKITFIPPRSYIFKPFYNLLGHLYFDAGDRKTDKKTLHGTTVYETVPTKPIRFRNYLTYSTNEEFKKTSVVDNEFSIKRIITMKEEDFWTQDYKGNTWSDWQTPTRFFISDLKKEELFSQD